MKFFPSFFVLWILQQEVILQRKILINVLLKFIFCFWKWADYPIAWIKNKCFAKGSNTTYATLWNLQNIKQINILKKINYLIKHVIYIFLNFYWL